MTKIAVIKTGGKQYKVKEKDTLRVEKLPGEAGTKVTFDEVLLVGDNESGEIKIGNPILKGSKVEAKILEQGRGKKVKVVKYKAKTRYTRVYGHRQPFTKVEITKLA